MPQQSTPIQRDVMLRVLHPPTAAGQCRSRSLGAGRISAIRYGLLPRRSFLNLPSVLVPPVVFGGLFVALWTWKCIMMVIFQNKIIYMPGLPPNSRSETIEDYKNQCQGIQWREERIRSIDGTRISLCVASVTNGADFTQVVKNVYVLYFQGNASSLPPRLPFLSPILRIVRDNPLRTAPVRYTFIGCSYRGYWTSRGRPTEKGIALDAAAALKWIETEREKDLDSGLMADEASVILWGQSIGAGVATGLAKQQELFHNTALSLKTVILETPFISIRAMLETLYPQKWLPYRYLWPFLRHHLDNLKALGILRDGCHTYGMKPPRILILEAGRDELVPQEHGTEIEKRCKELGLDVTKMIIANAYHTEVLVRPGGISAVVEALSQVGKESRM